MKVASISMKISEAMCWSVRTLRDPTQLPTHMNYEARTRSVKGTYRCVSSIREIGINPIIGSHTYTRQE